MSAVLLTNYKKFFYELFNVLDLIVLIGIWKKVGKIRVQDSLII